MVPLNTVLKTGDMVEIKTSRTSPGPSEGWLDFVASSNAKSAIRKFIAKKNAEIMREDRIIKGKQSCIDAFHERGIEEAEMVKMLNTDKVLNEYRVPDLDSLYVAVFGRKPTANAIVEFLKIKHDKEPVHHIMTEIHGEDFGKLASLPSYFLD